MIRRSFFAALGAVSLGSWLPKSEAGTSIIKLHPRKCSGKCPIRWVLVRSFNGSGPGQWVPASMPPRENWVRHSHGYDIPWNGLKPNGSKYPACSIFEDNEASISWILTEPAPGPVWRGCVA